MLLRPFSRVARLLPGIVVIAFCVSLSVLADEKVAESANSPNRQAELESALAKSLSGATLEGSFTSTGAGSDTTKLSREKYTLGEVKKVAGNLWQIPARIEYGGKDVTLPIVLPIRWAGDTPMVAVDDLPLPGFGAVSARVMFFDGHYAGYWKHGKHGGHLFGVIHPAEKAAGEAKPPAASGSSREPSAQQQSK